MKPKKDEAINVSADNEETARRAFVAVETGAVIFSDGYGTPPID